MYAGGYKNQSAALIVCTDVQNFGRLVWLKRFFTFGEPQYEKEALMLAAIAAVLLVLWLLGFLAFHVTFGAIHLLLVIAVVLFVAHFLTGRRAAV